MANNRASIEVANSNCFASAIVKNISTTGVSISDVPIALSDALLGMSIPTACQTDGCAGWTATTSNASNGCWLRYAGANLSDRNSGCLNGAADCWSGIWTGEDFPPNLRVESKHRSVHNGEASMQLIHRERRFRSSSCPIDGTASAVLAVFIDGATLELFANGGERALTATSAYATQSDLGLRVLDSGAVDGTTSTANFTAHAWEMKPAVFGNESIELEKKKKDKAPPFMQGRMKVTLG